MKLTITTAMMVAGVAVIDDETDSITVLAESFNPFTTTQVMAKEEERKQAEAAGQDEDMKLVAQYRLICNLKEKMEARLQEVGVGVIVPQEIKTRGGVN